MSDHGWNTAIERLAERESLRDAVSTLTLREADGRLADGRLSQEDHDAYVTLWTWTAARYTGVPGAAQERYYANHGADAYHDLLSSRRDAVERILGHDV